MPKFIGPKQQKKTKKGKKKTRAPKATVDFLQPKVISTRRPQAKEKRMPHHRVACALNDPFCIHARGAQIPDGVGGATFPIQLRGLYSMAAWGTNGTGIIQILANPLYPILGPSAQAANWTMATTSAAGPFNNTFFTNNADSVRIVSFGAIVRSAMTATLAKGTVLLSSVPVPNYGDTVGIGIMNSSENLVANLSANTSLTWVSKWIGVTHSQFRPISYYTTSQGALDMTSLQIEVYGSDITLNIPFVTVEVVMNIEFTAKSETGLAQAARPAPRPNKVGIAAAEVVQSTHPSFIEGAITQIGSSIEKAANSALDEILSTGMAFLGL
jgi:hypothetical protein